MKQEIKNIPLCDLILWSENPRDPIDVGADNKAIISQALNNVKKWELQKLAETMGDFYDFSELPTVVYHDGKPIVYDGNRRVALGLLSKGIINVKHEIKKFPSYEDEIPCNVCEKEVALQSIWRKHANSGSWDPLERDVFINKHLQKDKTIFLIIEEETNIISSHPCLNKNFVKDEIFSLENLDKLGFFIKDEKLLSKHSEEESVKILNDLALKVEEKNITTRKNRGKPYEVLEPENQRIVSANINNNLTEFSSKLSSKIETSSNNEEANRKKLSARKKKIQTPIFGGKLFLRSGDVSDLYRDITDLYQFYCDKRSQLSQGFSAIIRMALRLIVETAAKELGTSLDVYIKQHFSNVKSDLTKDEKTTLTAQNVKEESIIQLLQIGAHQYTVAKNMEQSLAISLIIGKILQKTHGK